MPAASPLLDTSAFVVTLAGINDEPPALTRVAAAIDAVNQLWTVAGELTGQRDSLALVAMEGGQTVSLAFDGAAEPLDELRDLMTSVWEQSARLPTVPPEQRDVLIPEMLPVMDRIGRSARADAVRLRALIETAVARLLEADCSLRGTPPPAAPAQRFAPRMFPPRQQAPLTQPARTAPPSATPEDLAALAEMIAEERRQLQPTAPAPRVR